MGRTRYAGRYCYRQLYVCAREGAPIENDNGTACRDRSRGRTGRSREREQRSSGARRVFQALRIAVNGELEQHWQKRLDAGLCPSETWMEGWRSSRSIRWKTERTKDEISTFGVKAVLVHLLSHLCVEIHQKQN